MSRTEQLLNVSATTRLGTKSSGRQNEDTKNLKFRAEICSHPHKNESFVKEKSFWSQDFLYKNVSIEKILQNESFSNLRLTCNVTM